MLQVEFKTQLAEIIANAITSVQVQFGSSNDPLTDKDNGLKGTKLAEADLVPSQAGAAFICKSDGNITLPAGTAKEIVIVNQDDVVMDRLLITDLVGGPNAEFTVEYRLEVAS